MSREPSLEQPVVSNNTSVVPCSHDNSTNALKGKVCPIPEYAVPTHRDPSRFTLEKAVVIGDISPLQDVLNNRNPPPFDLASFRLFAESKMCVELIDFWCAVEKFRTIDQVALEAQARYIYETFISEEGVQEINLSANMRKRVKKRFQEGIKTGDLTIFDETQHETQLLLLADVYPKFINHVHLQKNLALSREIALWWLNPPSLREFFTFPSPVNEVESRMHNICAMFLLAAATLLATFCDFPWLFIYIVYGYAARALAGPRLDPQAFVVLFILRPLFEDYIPIFKSRYVPSLPKQFSQMCGLFFSGMGMLLWFLNCRIAAYVFLSANFCAAALAGIFNICVACEMLRFGAMQGWLPKAWCEDCTTKYITGENHLKRTLPKTHKKESERKYSDNSTLV